MKTFKQHLTEAATSAAFEMERVIVSAAGGPSYTAKDKKISPDAGEKIVKKFCNPILKKLEENECKIYGDRFLSKYWYFLI